MDVYTYTGSMPPHSKYLWEEGMCVKSFKLVQNGIFQEEGVCYMFCFVLFFTYYVHIYVCEWNQNKKEKNNSEIDSSNLRPFLGIHFTHFLTRGTF